MKYILSTLLAFSFLHSTTAQTSFTDFANRSKSNLLPLHMLLPHLPFRGGGSSGSGAHFCAIFQVGATNARITQGNISLNGTGLALQYGLGAEFDGHSKKDNHKNIWSVALAYKKLNSTIKNYDVYGQEKKTDFKFQYLGLPISYASIIMGQSDVGFYWKAGVDIDYKFGVSVSGKEMNSQQSPIIFSPLASAGVSFPFYPKKGNYKSEQILLGPFISYTINNMLTIPNTSMNFLSYGLRFYVTQID